MAAYVIVLREGPFEDDAAYQEYLRILGESAPDPKMTGLSFYGDITALEGRPSEGVVLLQFPTVEDAKNWYYGDYQAAAPHRIRSADYRVMIVQGM